MIILIYTGAIRVIAPFIDYTIRISISQILIVFCKNLV